MDDPDASPESLSRALHFIRLVNRRLGGVSALLTPLREWSRDWRRGETITLLDVATGSADLPLAASKWARAGGFDLRITGIDIHPTTLELGRTHAAGDPAITLALGDALTIADTFGHASFDYVHAGLFLHHLDEPDILAALAAMRTVARRGVIWNDLIRSRTGHAAIRLATIGCDAMTRHDAVVSVEAGFTRSEAMDLARRGGLPSPQYRWNLFTHRFTLTSALRPGVST